MATSLELSLVRVRLLPLPFGGIFPFLVLFGDSHPPRFARNSFRSTVFRLHSRLLYVAVHVSFCILLRDSHSSQGSNLPCGFLLSSPCQNPHIAQPYCLFLPTQPSSRMPSQMLGLCWLLVSKATSPFSGICCAHFSNTNFS